MATMFRQAWVADGWAGEICGADELNDAIMSSEISTVLDLFPDLGEGFIQMSLEVEGPIPTIGFEMQACFRVFVGRRRGRQKNFPTGCT